MNFIFRFIVLQKAVKLGRAIIGYDSYSRSTLKFARSQVFVSKLCKKQGETVECDFANERKFTTGFHLLPKCY